MVEPEEIASQTGLSYLHSTHCLADGNIMVSTMGDPSGGAKGNFLLLDQDLKVCCTALWSALPPCRLAAADPAVHMQIKGKWAEVSGLT